jgi:hypothetical protein
VATISRDQFDRTKQVQKKIFQSGAFVLDSDLNEQIDIALENRRRTLSCVLNHVDGRFDDGFSVEGGHANDLTVTLKAGNAGFHLDDDHAAMLTLDSDTNITGFASWGTSGQRTDIIYLDLQEVEFGAGDDLDIVNPIVGQETCRDIRAVWTVAIANNQSTLPTAPAGHVYRELARITKDGTTDAISDDDITTAVPHFRGSALQSMEIPIWTLSTVNHAGGNADSLTDTAQQFSVTATSTDLVQKAVVKIPYIYDPAHRYLALYCQVWKDNGVRGLFELEGLVYGGFQSWIWELTPSLQMTFLVPSSSGGVPGQMYELYIMLKAQYEAGQSGDLKVYMQKPIIVAGLGSWDAADGARVLTP